MASVPALDMEKVQAFAFKVVGDITAAQMGTLSVVADRLGLFPALAEAGRSRATSSPSARGSTSATRASGSRRWPATATSPTTTAPSASRLPPEHAFVLADPDSPLYLGSFPSMAATMWANIDLLTEAFKHGGGVPQERYGDEFWCGFERFTRTGFRNNLVQDWLPAMPQADAALRAGGSVADVGCGNGQALLFLAQGYPEATLVGYDNYAPAIEAANANARAAGLADRVRYEVCDVTQGIPGTYDLITTFDVVHDMPQPRPAMKEIKQALKPDGTYFVLEFNFSGDLQENIDHPLGIGAFGYSASTNYCMTQALAAGGEGTGTCMGEEKMREFAAEGGFTQLPPARLPAEPLQPLLRDPRLMQPQGCDRGRMVL